MATKIHNIDDWPRGTNPPIRINLSDPQGIRSLVGSTIAIVIRDENWEDSLTDESARVKRRVRCWQVQNEDDLEAIVGASENDLCWVNEFENVRVYDGSEWVPGNTEENHIVEGQLTFRFSRSEMMLPVGSYYYSIDIRLPDGEVAKILKGKLKITPNTVNEL